MTQNTKNLFERIRCKELEDNLGTAQIMSTVFELQLALQELELPNLANKLAELVDNINKASMHPIWETNEYDERQKRMLVKINVSLDAYIVLCTMHEVFPKHKALADYVELLERTSFKDHPIAEELSKSIHESAAEIKEAASKMNQ